MKTFLGAVLRAFGYFLFLTSLLSTGSATARGDWGAANGIVALLTLASAN